MQTLTEFRRFLIDRMRAVRPGVVVLVYSTNVYYPTKGAGNTLEHARVCFAGTEGTDLTWAGASNLYAQHRISRAFSEFWGRPTWAQYPTPTEAGRVFGSFFFAPVTGNGPWGWLRIYHGDTVAKVCTWEHLDEAFAYGDPVADVGVLLSTANRWGPQPRCQAHADEVSGWLQAFGLRGVQFNPVPSKYAEWRHVAPYRALIVPDCYLLPKHAAGLVARVVQEGGAAVVTGVPGRYDVLGYPLGEESLLRRMGLRCVEAADEVFWHRKKQQYLNTRDRAITLAPGVLPSLPRQIALPGSYRFDAALNPGAEHTVLARFGDGKPAIYSIRSGRGRYVYLGFLPGHLSARPRARQRMVVEERSPPAVLDLMEALAREATGADDRIKVDGRGIISSAWQKGDKVWVRMVNVSGAQALPVGKPVGKSEPTYPALDAIRIHVHMPVKPQASLVTPDRERPMLLRVTKSRVVDIPPGAFKTFGFVRMEAAQ